MVLQLQVAVPEGEEGFSTLKRAHKYRAFTGC
jgi:hypothetical protein